MYMYVPHMRKKR